VSMQLWPEYDGIIVWPSPRRASPAVTPSAVRLLPGHGYAQEVSDGVRLAPGHALLHEGSVSIVNLSGIGSVTIPSATVAATGTVEGAAAAGTVLIPVSTVSGAGNQTIRDVGTDVEITLPSVTSAGAGRVIVSGDGHITLGVVTSSAIGSLTEAEIKSVTITLVTRSGQPRSNLNSLKWAFFDEQIPNELSSPIAQGEDGTTDESGSFTIELPLTSLDSGDIGFLIISDTDGTTAQTNAFAAPVEVD
jgi:hypothetical protein